MNRRYDDGWPRLVPSRVVLPICFGVPLALLVLLLVATLLGC